MKLYELLKVYTDGFVLPLYKKLLKCLCSPMGLSLAFLILEIFGDCDKFNNLIFISHIKHRNEIIQSVRFVVNIQSYVDNLILWCFFASFCFSQVSFVQTEESYLISTNLRLACLNIKLFCSFNLVILVIWGKNSTV